MKPLSIITLLILQVTFYFPSFAVEQATIPLWPNLVPGETEAKAAPTIDENHSGNITRINKVTDPTLIVYEPQPEKRNGAAVVICPGGGYHILAIDLEGSEIAEWLSSLGYTAFVLQYRVPQKADGALQDVARAIRVVRASHDKWGIDKEKIGVLGFSAGGSLSARISCRFDEDLYGAVDARDSESARPNFTVLIYPAYLDHGPNNSLTPELDLNKNIPPMFLYVAADDRHASSSLVMGSALREKNIPVELHMLPDGGHGYGLRKGKRAAETWPQYCETWLNETVLKSETLNLPFDEGDRVCFVGDSLTHGGGFHHDILLYHMTRFPSVEVAFFNCGIGGDVAESVLRRMDEDVLNNNPDRAMLMLGGNDVQRWLFAPEMEVTDEVLRKRAEAITTYEEDMEKLVSRFCSENVKLVLQTPAIYDERTNLETPANVGVNQALQQCTDITKKLAQKYQLPVADYWTPMEEISVKLNQLDPNTTIVGKDRVHPGEAGNFIMCYSFLKAAHAPRYVSKVVVGKEAREVENAKVKQVKWKKDSLSFTCKASALPYPLTEEKKKALEFVSFNEDFNVELLQVPDLADGDYSLVIDDQHIGSFPAEELRQGINLTLFENTPQYQQAVEVRTILEELWELEGHLRDIKFVESRNQFAACSEITDLEDLSDCYLEKFKDSQYLRYHRYVIGEYVEHKPAEESYHGKIEELRKKAYKRAKPKAHHYRISLNQVAQLPPMGWNSWNTFKKEINEQLFMETADAMIASGLAEAGYVYVNIDDGWSPDDNASVALEDKFPNGIGYLADYMHERNLKLGLYSNWRSHGHEERDATQWAEWKIDFIKNDAWKTLSTDPCWNRMRDALAATGRPIVHSVHFSDEDSNPPTIAETANMWRITNDIVDYYDHESIPEDKTDWAFATLDIIDRMAEVTHLIKPGCWADPDMLEIGNGNQTVDEYKTQFTLWCLLPAPLLLGNDVRNMDDETLEILLNKEAIAVNQDPAVIPAQRIRKTDEMELWSRKLADGSLCVVLLQKTESAKDLEFTWKELGLKMDQPAEIRDLWAHETLGSYTNTFSITVNAHGCAMLKLTQK